MATINYDDKVALNENSSIADINKVNASDMNLIKEVVNENANTLDNLLSNVYGTSNENGYTQDYINTAKQDTLTSTDWISLGNTVYYKKYGNIVTVKAYSLGDVSLTTNDYKTVATLPEGARPSITLAFPWAIIGEGQVGVTRIHNSGVIELYSTSAQSYWAFTITYVI